MAAPCKKEKSREVISKMLKNAHMFVHEKEYSIFQSFESC